MSVSCEQQLSVLDRVASALAEGTGEGAVYRAVGDGLGELIGHRLFTLFIVLPGRQEIERVWTSDPVSYPVRGRKRLGRTPWGELVLEQRKPFLGTDAAAIRWAYADHEKIAGLGLGSAMNIPVIRGGTILGAMALLHEEGHFNAEKLSVAMRFAPYLISAFDEEIEAATGA